MRIVVAIGGNALLQRGQSPEILTQRINIKQACASIAKLANEHEIIITHGNGPQIGLLALQSDAYKKVPPYPLDVLNAESQGMIGYMLAQELKNQLPRKEIIFLLTQIEVAATDPAFLKPEKFIGPTYSQQQMDELCKSHSWQFAKDGDVFRRVVPSPLPKNILEIESIRSLVDKNRIVICVGGGGVPVIRDINTQQYSGVEAVIDKDYASALLAEQLHADRLLILTDVENVMINWGKPNATPLGIIHWHELEKMTFPSGSMGPKINAVCQFVKNTQQIAHIGLLSQAEANIQQLAGTTIIP